MKYRIAFVVAFLLAAFSMVLADDQSDAAAAIATATSAKNAATTAENLAIQQKIDQQNHLADVTTRFKVVAVLVMAVPADYKTYCDAFSWEQWWVDNATACGNEGSTSRNAGNANLNYAINSFKAGKYNIAWTAANDATANFNDAKGWFGNQSKYVKYADASTFDMEKIVTKYEGN